MTTEDLGYFTEYATANWGSDFTAPGSADMRRCFLVWKRAQEDGWGSEEFRSAVDRFIARAKFPTWTIADFFEAKRPKVYGHAWYRENWPKHGAEGIGTYEVTVAGERRPVWGLRSECDGLLPVWEDEHVPDEQVQASVESQTEAARDFMAPATRQAYSETMDRLRSELQIEEKREAVAMMERSKSIEDRTIEQLQAEVERLTEENAELRTKLPEAAMTADGHV